MVKYYRRNWLAKWRLSCIDLVLGLYGAWRGRQHQARSEPASMLLVSPGHLGDALLTTALVRELFRQRPGLDIGVICGSWAVPVFESTGVPLRIHVIDHWSLNRKESSIARKWLCFLRTLRPAMAAVRRHRYEAAAVLSAFEPSFIPYLKLAGCNAIAGFTTAGWSPLLHYAVDPEAVPGPHEVQKQAAVLEPWLGPVKPAAEYRPLIRQCQPHELSAIDERLAEMDLSRGSYVVLQAGSGNAAKEWSVQSWKQLIDWLQSSGWYCVLVGQGDRDRMTNDTLERLAATRLANLTNRLSWRELVEIIRGARLVVGVDSVAAHICAGTETPFLGVYSGISRVERWISLGKTVVAVRRDMPCSPCHTRPCPERTCILGISGTQVVRQLESLLAK